jgi:tetratricopeptide (TPR) repeat protein
MSVAGDLERARLLAYSDDHAAAKELLVSLMPQIEALDRDDLILEVFAQLGEIYLTRSAYDGVAESIRRIRDCVSIYTQILAGSRPDLAGQVTLSESVIREMAVRYTRRADGLDVGLAAATGDHRVAIARLAALNRFRDGDPGLADEAREIVVRARIRCAVAAGDNNDLITAGQLWETLIADLDEDDRSACSDHMWVVAGLGYGRFCTYTGRLDEADPVLRRAGARAVRRSWELAVARTELERGAVAWARSEYSETERLVRQAYPVISTHAVADDVSRCWLYLGLTRMAAGRIEAADECWQHAQRHWEELGKPLEIHRIMLQRSWIDIFRGRFEAARETIDAARTVLGELPGSTWLHRARLDDLLGSTWRAEALSDMGFDGAGDPDDDWRALEARLAGSLGVVTATAESPGFRRAMPKFERAAELKIPAALALDSVRHTMADADERWRWTTVVSAPIMAGAFAVAWEWEKPALVAELIEYHSARGTFSAESGSVAIESWATAGTAAIPVLDDAREPAMAAAGTVAGSVPALTRSGPLPPVQMDPTGGPILARYRELATRRYGRMVTSDEPVWTTWP